MTLTLQRPTGTVAYDVEGSGDLVVCVPGMGDLRQTYRFLAPALVAAGHRVATTDLRGHGDSSADFDAYGTEATASDVEALVEQLGGPAVLVGSSMAAGAVVQVAARRPDLVSGLALLGPFVREPQTGTLTRLLMRAAMVPLWAGAVWSAYLPSLYPATRPDDFAAYRTQVRAALRRPGHAAAFSRTTRASQAGTERVLDDVHVPVLVVMGADDPDWKDPAGEARWIGDRLSGEVVLVPECGHYPQSQRLDVVLPAVTAFTRRVAARA